MTFSSEKRRKMIPIHNLFSTPPFSSKIKEEKNHNAAEKWKKVSTQKYSQISEEFNKKIFSRIVLTLWKLWVRIF